jgi:hypothetical protein
MKEFEKKHSQAVDDGLSRRDFVSPPTVMGVGGTLLNTSDHELSAQALKITTNNERHK